MNGTSPGSPWDRVLVLAPGGRDAAVACAILREGGLPPHACADAAELVGQLERGAAAACLTEEALRAPGVAGVARWVAQQPPWSDLPVIVMTRRAGSTERQLAALHLSEMLGNVLLLERPFHPTALVSLARTSLRVRRRQYEARRNLDELQAAAASLADADRRKDEFLAMLAHELRNPLAPLTNAHRLLARSDALAGPDRTALAMAIRQTDQLTRLVDDLLEVGRVTGGKIELRPEPMELCAAVRAAVDSIETSIGQRRQTVQVALPAEPVELVADPARLAQVLENLLHNASKYTPEGGSIRVELEVDSERLLVRVIDDGVGIEPHELTRIFTLFSQVDSTIDRSQGGLGIGLALVRQLVELHGGTVSATSPGKYQGACFTVSLPRGAAIEPAPAEMDPARPAAVQPAAARPVAFLAARSAARQIAR